MLNVNPGNNIKLLANGLENRKRRFHVKSAKTLKQKFDSYSFAMKTIPPHRHLLERCSQSAVCSSSQWPPPLPSPSPCTSKFCSHLDYNDLHHLPVPAAASSLVI